MCNHIIARTRPKPCPSRQQANQKGYGTTAPRAYTLPQGSLPCRSLCSYIFLSPTTTGCSGLYSCMAGCGRMQKVEQGGGGDAPLTGISVTTEERANVTHQRVVEGCWELFGAAEGCGGLLGRVWVLDPNPSLCPASSILLTLSLGPLVGLAKRPALPLHSNPSQGWPSQREGPCRKNWSQLCALHLKGLIHTGGGTRIHTLLQQPWVHQHLSWPHCHHTHTPLLPGREHQQQLSCE